MTGTDTNARNNLTTSAARNIIPTDAKLQIVDIASVLKQPKPVYLSEIAGNIRYVALETTTKYLIGDKSVNIRPCEGLFFVAQHEKPVAVFDASGRFLRTIGRIGRGPGEYNFDYVAWPEETQQRLYVWNADAGTIMMFSWDGRHIGDIKPSVRFMAFVPLGNNRFISWTFMQEHDDGGYFRLFMHDETGKILRKYYEPKKEYDFSRGVAIMTPLFTPTAAGYLYNTWENDTIMRISHDGSFQSAFSWQSGKLKMPYKLGSADHDRFVREMNNYVIDCNAMESPTRWFGNFDYKRRRELFMVEKASGDCFLIANQDTATKSVFNDIDCGPSFWPQDGSGSGKTFIEVIQAIDLIDPAEGRPANLPVRNPEAAKKLRELVSKLTENSNPVLMLVDLK
jgi:hypothetical protein